MVKHKVIPAYSSEVVGGTVKPAHTLGKVLVSPISIATEKEYTISIWNVLGDDQMFISNPNTHISCSSQFITAREQSSLMVASKGVLGEKEKRLKSRENQGKRLSKW